MTLTPDDFSKLLDTAKKQIDAHLASSEITGDLLALGLAVVELALFTHRLQALSRELAKDVSVKLKTKSEDK